MLEALALIVLDQQPPYTTPIAALLFLWASTRKSKNDLIYRVNLILKRPPPLDKTGARMFFTPGVGALAIRRFSKMGGDGSGGAAAYCVAVIVYDLICAAICDNYCDNLATIRI